MLYFEELDTRLCLGVEKMTPKFPCATSEQPPQPTSTIIHLLVTGVIASQPHGAASPSVIRGQEQVPPPPLGS